MFGNMLPRTDANYLDEAHPREFVNTKRPFANCNQKHFNVYIGGALANPEIVRITALLKDNSISAFSEWYTPGAEADVKWRDYEIALGYDYRTALKRPAAVNTFTFDKRHIDECDTFLMVLPCGKSAHMELGYAIGKGKRGIIYMPNEPERWDVMYGFADRIVMTDKELLEALHNGK